MLVADAVLEKLCVLPNGEYRHDPIALTVACLKTNPEQAHSENPVWRAAAAVGQTQVKYLHWTLRVVKKYNVSPVSISRTRDTVKLNASQ